MPVQEMTRDVSQYTGEEFFANDSYQDLTGTDDIFIHFMESLTSPKFL